MKPHRERGYAWCVAVITENRPWDPSRPGASACRRHRQASVKAAIEGCSESRAGGQPIRVKGRSSASAASSRRRSATRTAIVTTPRGSESRSVTQGGILRHWHSKTFKAATPTSAASSSVRLRRELWYGGGAEAARSKRANAIGKRFAGRQQQFSAASRALARRRHKRGRYSILIEFKKRQGRRLCRPRLVQA